MLDGMTLIRPKCDHKKVRMHSANPDALKVQQ